MTLEFADEHRIRRHARWCCSNKAESELARCVDALVSYEAMRDDVRRIFAEELRAHRKRSDEERNAQTVSDQIESLTELAS